MLPNAFLREATHIAGGWALFLQYHPGQGSHYSTPPLDCVLVCGDPIFVREFVIPVDAPAGRRPKGLASDTGVEFHFLGLVLGTTPNELPRRWAIVLSIASLQAFVTPFTADDLVQGEGPPLQEEEARLLADAAFTALAERSVRTVAHATPVRVLAPRTRSSASASSAAVSPAASSAASPADPSATPRLAAGSMPLRVPTSLHNVGAARLMQTTTEDLRLTSLALLAEKPEAMKHFEGVDITQATKRSLARALYSATKPDKPPTSL